MVAQSTITVQPRQLDVRRKTALSPVGPSILDLHDMEVHYRGLEDDHDRDLGEDVRETLSDIRRWIIRG